MQRMRQARRESGRLAGRPLKPTHDEAREEALKRLAPRALQKLEEQLESEDDRIAQTAALRILEWQWGKPTTPVEDVTERPTAILWEHPAMEGAARLARKLERQAVKSKALPSGSNGPD